MPVEDLLETLDVSRDEAALGDVMSAGREDEWYTLDDVRAAMKPERRAAVVGE